MSLLPAGANSLSKASFQKRFVHRGSYFSSVQERHSRGRGVFVVGEGFQKENVNKTPFEYLFSVTAFYTVLVFVLF